MRVKLEGADRHRIRLAIALRTERMERLAIIRARAERLRAKAAEVDAQANSLMVRTQTEFDHEVGDVVTAAGFGDKWKPFNNAIVAGKPEDPEAIEWEPPAAGPPAGSDGKQEPPRKV